MSTQIPHEVFGEIPSMLLL